MRPDSGMACALVLAIMANRLLVVVPHERPHGIMRILKNPCMLLPKALKMRAIKDTMALVADSIGGT